MASMLDIMMGGQSSAGSGWQRAGAALGEAMSGGGGASGQRAYDEAMLRGHRTQKALKDAQKATLEYQSMMDLEEQLEPLFGDRAGAAAATLNAGHNLQQTMAGRQRMFQGDALSAALEGVQGGAGLADVNPLLAISRGQPVQTTKVEGNTIISPYEAMTAQDPQLTPFAEGRLRNDAARVAGQNAASMVRATAPRSSGGATAEGITADARKSYEAYRKQKAQEFLTSAKLAGNDVAGMSLADIISQMESTGDVFDMEGNKIGHWGVSLEDYANPKPKPDFSNVRNHRTSPSAAMGGATKPATGVSTAAPGAPVTEPKGATRAPTSGGTMEVARPSSKAEYDALPSGTRFIAPDGTERIKP